MTDTHESIRTFIESAAEAFQLQGPVYEFSFSPKEDAAVVAELLAGIDAPQYAIEPDETVQIERLEDLVRLPFPDGSARTVVCVNALEHAFEPQRAVAEMIRMLAPGGMLLICSPVAGPLAQQPDQYWHLTPQAVQRLLTGLEGTLVGWQGSDQSPHTVFGLGCKPPVAADFFRGTRPFLDFFQQRLDEAAAKVSRRCRLWRLLTGWAQSAAERRCRQDFHKSQFVVDLPAGRHLKHHLLESCLPTGQTGTGQTGTRLDLQQ